VRPLFPRDSHGYPKGDLVSRWNHLNVGVFLACQQHIRHSKLDGCTCSTSVPYRRRTIIWTLKRTVTTLCKSLWAVMSKISYHFYAQLTPDIKYVTRLFRPSSCKKSWIIIQYVEDRITYFNALPDKSLLNNCKWKRGK